LCGPGYAGVRGNHCLRHQPQRHRDRPRILAAGRH
jgi:hypothetical protein